MMLLPCSRLYSGRERPESGRGIQVLSLSVRQCVSGEATGSRANAALEVRATRPSCTTDQLKNGLTDELLRNSCLDHLAGVEADESEAELGGTVLEATEELDTV